MLITVAVILLNICRPALLLLLARRSPAAESHELFDAGHGKRPFASRGRIHGDCRPYTYSTCASPCVCACVLECLSSTQSRHLACLLTSAPAHEVTGSHGRSCDGWGVGGCKTPPPPASHGLPMLRCPHPSTQLNSWWDYSPHTNCDYMRAARSCIAMPTKFTGGLIGNAACNARNVDGKMVNLSAHILL